METQESRYEIHYQLANTNKMLIIQARCENVQLVSDRKAFKGGGGGGGGGGEYLIFVWDKYF